MRICAIGDSLVADVGDPEHRGWVGRRATATHDPSLTLYNLGVRRDTTRDVLARWRREIPPRLRTPDPIEGRIAVSFGVNDATAVPGGHGPVHPGRPRDPGYSLWVACVCRAL